jgi:hypothetical protein
MDEYKEAIDVWLERHVLISEKKIKATSDEGFWAWEAINELVFNSPEEAWLVILELIRLAPSERILADIAAGPLEDLIRNHTDAIIDRVEQEARRDPKFRLCLTGVWYGNDLSQDVRARIEKYTSSSRKLGEEQHTS